MARAEPLQDLRQARVRQGETSFAAAENAMGLRQLRAHVPGSVHNDGARKRVVVGRIETGQPDRAAMRADIKTVGSVRTRGGGVRLGFVGEALEPARVRRV